MGRWGAGLYADDKAADLRQSIALIAIIPAPGDRLLEILLRQAGRTPELTDSDGCTFWLVIADQFERRGIRCDTVLERALAAIDRARHHGEIGKSTLDQLAKRLRSPRPERTRPRSPKRPEHVVGVGDVYAFRTMAGLPFGTYIRSAADLNRRNFVPDGWGVIVIVDLGRAFEWIPWCAVASVAVDPSEPPVLDAVTSGELLYHAQTHGATRCIPKRSELKDVGFQLLGTLSLDPIRAQTVVADWPSAEESVELGWPIKSVTFGRNCRFAPSLPSGPRLSTLVTRRTAH
jgi:hypothetical protein